METGEHAIVELRELRNRVKVFRDREHAGEMLAGMLVEYRGTDTRVLGILAGGVPVAAAISRALDLPLDVAVVSKITLPWNSEMGYGAVAFDGTVQLNDALIQNLGLAHRDVETGIARTREKVNSRLRRFPRGARGGASPAMPSFSSTMAWPPALPCSRRLRPCNTPSRHACGWRCRRDMATARSELRPRWTRCTVPTCAPPTASPSPMPMNAGPMSPKTTHSSCCAPRGARTARRISA